MCCSVLFEFSCAAPVADACACHISLANAIPHLALELCGAIRQCAIAWTIFDSKELKSAAQAKATFA